MKRQGKAGFTMAELLIVVAIIAVLVAIAIPVFTSQLEKSREATDLANVRAAYAQVMSASITEDKQAQYEGELIYDSGSDSYVARVPLKQKRIGWESYPVTIAEVTVTAENPNNDHWQGLPGAGGTCTVTYGSAGVVFNWDGEGSEAPTPEGTGLSKTIYTALQDFFVTNKKYASMSSWDSLYTNQDHVGIKAINTALEGKGVVSCSVINTLFGDDGDILGSSSKNGVIDQTRFGEIDRGLYYLWTTDGDAKDLSLQNKATIPVMVARTNANGVKEYAVIETPVLQGDRSSYNALSSYKGEDGKIKRPNHDDYDINKLIGDAQFNTNYAVVEQEYNKKLSSK